jgi:hypothetical protein
MDRRRFAIVVAVLAAASCFGRAAITVRNESGVEVQDLHLQGRCFSEKVGVLAPGASKSIRVKPCGESGVVAKFTAGRTSREAPEVGYIEASSFYSVNLVIRPDLSVHASGR